MKKNGTIVGLLVSVIIIWHIVIHFSNETILTGFFQEKPKVGYVWQNDLSGNQSKFFWNAGRAVWHPGYLHPDFHAIASEEEGKWAPLAGYKWQNDTGKETIWEPGQIHPKFKAFASQEEGKWFPLPGYNFVFANNEVVDVAWEPGQINEQMKVIACNDELTFRPYPGYQFINPGRDLTVQWTPGVSDPYGHPNQIAGDTEGTWLDTADYEDDVVAVAEDNEPHFARFALGILLGRAVEGIVGENNEASNFIYKESVKEGIKGISKAIQ